MTGTNTVAALSISFSSLIKNIHVRTDVDDDDGDGDDVDDGDSGDDDNDNDDLSPGLKTKGSGHQEQQPLSILPHSLNHHLSTFMVMITTMINITNVTTGEAVTGFSQPVGGKSPGLVIDGKSISSLFKQVPFSPSYRFLSRNVLFLINKLDDQVESQKQLETLSQRCQTVIACR